MSLPSQSQEIDKLPARGAVASKPVLFYWQKNSGIRGAAFPEIIRNASGSPREKSRWFCLLLIISLLGIDVLLTLPAEAQFGSGRSRDSIFNRRRNTGRTREEPRQTAPVQAPPAPQPQQQQIINIPQMDAPPVQPPQPLQPQPGVVQPGVPQPVVPGAPGVPGARPGTGRKPAPGKGPPGQGQEAKPTGGIPPEGQITLRVAPMDQKADVGDIFPVHVWLDNPKNKPFEVVSLALAFDPRTLEYIDPPGGMRGVPNAYDLSEKIRSGLPLVRDPAEDPFYLNMVDPANGMIYYRARCPTGDKTTGHGFVITMKFKALAPIEQTGLRFVFADWPENLAPPVQSDQTWKWPKEMTFVGGQTSDAGSADGWVNLLGSTSSAKDGVISGHMTLKGDYLAALEKEAEKLPKGQAGTRIYLDPQATVIQAGKTFQVNVKISNPRGVPWDKIRLDIHFDPSFLKVVDEDDGNWITLGTNIHDAPYHDRFPFEWTRTNMVRNDEGQILFECGVFKSPLRVGGTLATIHFQALRPIPETQIAFRMPVEVTERLGTVLTRKRLDVLGDTEDAGDGVRGSIVSIVPRSPQESGEKQAKGKFAQD
ncbi:cohesin domain-containing protein [bacterium]|nr:cohesin domain-containing protein [bacterium]